MHRTRPKLMLCSSRQRAEVKETMSASMLSGLMMEDFPLSLTAVVERAGRFSATREVVSRRPDGSIHRGTLGGCVERARLLSSAATPHTDPAAGIRG